jgi:SAM-dependent methyltransferase
MPFVAHRALNWAPIEIDETWKLNTVPKGLALTVCNSLQCETCRLLFLDIRFDDTEMNSLYSGYRESEYVKLRDQYEPGYAKRNSNFEARAEWLPAVEALICPHLQTPEFGGGIRILDFGGDTGINTPFRLAGGEIDVYDISAAVTLEGVRPVSSSYALTQNYDLVVCSMLLEHVSDPAEILLEVAKYLKPESLLYIEVPYETLMRELNDSLQAVQSKRHWHEHINFYSRVAMRKLLEQTGFHIVEENILEAPTSTSGWVFQVLVRVS